MRKIIGFRTLCVGLGIWVGTVVVSAQGEFKALPWSQSTAYNSYLMRDVHRQFASRQSAIQQAFTSPAGMQEYLEGCRERYKQIVGTFPEKENLNVQVVGKIQGTGYHIEKIIFESHNLLTLNQFVLLAASFPECRKYQRLISENPLQNFYRHRHAIH